MRAGPPRPWCAVVARSGPPRPWCAVLVPTAPQLPAPDGQLDAYYQELQPINGYRCLFCLEHVYSIRRRVRSGRIHQRVAILGEGGTRFVPPRAVGPALAGLILGGRDNMCPPPGRLGLGWTRTPAVVILGGTNGVLPTLVHEPVTLDLQEFGLPTAWRFACWLIEFVWLARLFRLLPVGLGGLLEGSWAAFGMLLEPLGHLCQNVGTCWWVLGSWRPLAAKARRSRRGAQKTTINQRKRLQHLTVWTAGARLD